MLQALTFDLDDTLWPNGPVILRAEQALRDWLQQHAPATAERFPVREMQRLRAEVGAAHPALAHDMGQMRRLTLQRALRESGDDPGLADAAFEVFFEARQRVVLYEDVGEALERLARRFRLLALSNGNADVHRAGLGAFFVGSVSAYSVGVPKPDARMFKAGCAALALPPSAVMHVGDHWAADVLGARAAGLHSTWVRRPDCALVPDETAADATPAGQHLVVPDLLALADALGC